MNQPRIAIIGLLAGLAVAATALTGRADNAPAPALPAGPSKIAVIDFRKAYSNMAETQTSNATLKGMQGDLEDTVASHKHQLETLQKEMNELKAGSSQREDLMDQLYQKGLQFDMEEKGKQIRMARLRGHQMKKALDEIGAACAEYAKKYNVDAVLVNSSNELPENVGDMSNQDQLVNLIFGRNFLYVSPNIDITDKIVAMVDAAAKTAPAPAPAAGH